MIIYDFIRGYQPFYPPKFVPFWVKENLEQVFLPTSQAMRGGVVRRHIVIQAWTLDNWLRADARIRDLTKEFILNIKEALRAGHIQIGASAYTNTILPLLSNELVEFSIRAGVEAVSEKFGPPPTWFWFPDGAVDRRVLEILHRLYPDLIAVVPDGCLGKENYSGFGWVEYGRRSPIPPLRESPSGHSRSVPRLAKRDGSEGIPRGRVIIFNTLLKFLFLDSYMYDEKPVFIPKSLNFDLATKMAYDSKSLASVLKVLGGSLGTFVLVREWENKTSRDGLAGVETEVVSRGYPAMDISSFIKNDGSFEFALLSEDSWNEAEVFKISQVKPFCWEPFASNSHPYPLWSPASVEYLTKGQKAVIESWRSFLDTCNSVLSKEPKVEYLPLLISDIPWNVLAPVERKPDPMFVKRIVEEMFMKIVEKVGDRKLSRRAEGLYRAVGKYVEESYDLGKQ